jgi:hypothetical protein
MDKLQRAGRNFLLRLIALHGLAAAARVLRALAGMNSKGFTRIQIHQDFGLSARSAKMPGRCEC